MFQHFRWQEDVEIHTEVKAMEDEVETINNSVAFQRLCHAKTYAKTYKAENL